MDSDEFSSAEDSYEKQEIEAILYSQVYHNYSQESDNLDDVSTDGEHLSTRKAFKEGTFDDSLAPDDGPVRDCKRDEDQSHLAGPKNRKSVKDAKYFKENGGDIQIVKEVVKIQHEDSDSDVVEVVSNNDKRANKRKISSSSDSETESGMPFWSRLDSGIINSDSKLNVNFHMNIAGSRKRNDSILSRTSSCLGEDDTSYIKIQDSEYDSLEQVLNTLPDDGWDIIHSDYKVKSLATKSPLRYHNMKCRNCNRLGHLSSVCPEAKKVKRCLLCSEIHAGKSKRNFCPETRCVNCLEQGHESKACPSLKELRHTFCRRCKTRGHKSKLCHELWRQWHITTEPLNTYPVVCENFVLNKPEYCAMCGLVGHFTHTFRKTENPESRWN